MCFRDCVLVFKSRLATHLNNAASSLSAAAKLKLILPSDFQMKLDKCVVAAARVSGEAAETLQHKLDKY